MKQDLVNEFDNWSREKENFQKDIERIKENQEYVKREKLLVEYESKRLEDLNSINAQTLLDIKRFNDELKNENERLINMIDDYIKDNLELEQKLKNVEYKLTEQVAVSINFEKNLV